MSKLKPEFASNNEDMRRIVKKAQRAAGAYEDTADVSVLNDISRLEFLKTETHGISNALLEVDKLEAVIRRQAAIIRSQRAKLKKIHSQSTGWDDEE